MNELDPNNKYEFATFTDRVIACILDRLLLGTILAPFTALFFGRQVIDLKVALEQGTLTVSVYYMMFQIIVSAAIVIFFWIKFSATPGKMVFKIRVLNEDYQPASQRQYIIRYIAYSLSLLSFGLGFVLMLFDDRKQAVHDKVARTIVVKELIVEDDNNLQRKSNQRDDRIKSTNKLPDDEFIA